MSAVDRDYAGWVSALRASHERADNLVRRLDAETLVSPSYCDGWSIAQVLSHLGSGAEITSLMIDAAIGGPPTAAEAREQIWAEWNGKEPQQQAADFQVADERLVNRWETLGPDEIDRFEAEIGPWKLKATEAVGMRLGEHVLHTWDVDVALDPDATLPPDAAGLLLTRLARMAGFAGKADQWSGGPVRLNVELSDPKEQLVLEIGEKVELSEADVAAPAADGELAMPAEAFVRLFYGRLDPGHTPESVSVKGRVGLDELRKIFPGY